MRIGKEVLEYARKQFCLDINMPWEQYCREPEKKVYIQSMSRQDGRMQGARIIEQGDDFFRAITCLGQLFLLVDEQIYDWAVQEFAQCAPEWFCSYSNLRKIDCKLRECGREIMDTHLYYLPAGEAAVAPMSSPVQWFDRQDILRWKGQNRFPHAVCYSSTQPDMLAVAAMEWDWPTDRDGAKDFDQSHMLGMAGVSGDGAYLWQIGIDVEPGRRCNGLAAGLVQLMKEEVLRRGRIPFYGTSESHGISQSVAYHAGFMPAWAEIYVKKTGN